MPMAGDEVVGLSIMALREALVHVLSAYGPQTKKEIAARLRSHGRVTTTQEINSCLYKHPSRFRRSASGALPRWSVVRASAEPAGAPPRNVAPARDPLHGTGCECHLQPLDAVPLGATQRQRLKRWAQATGVTDIGMMIHALDAVAADLGPNLADAVGAGIEVLMVSDCPAEAFAGDAEVGWRTHVVPGLDSLADTWPEGWDGVDWSNWCRSNHQLDSSRTVQWQAVDAIVNGLSWPPMRVRTARERAERVLADRGDLWIDSPAVDPAGRGEWSLDECVRLLASARTDASPSHALLTEISRTSGAGIGEVLAYWRYVRQCDQGLAPADDLLRRVFAQFPAHSPQLLTRRVRMLEGTSLRSDADLEDSGDPELLDAVEAPLTLPTAERRVAHDGGPNPLAVVRTLLPGGEGTRGKPPIVYTETLLDRVLYEAILARKPTLVVLSGNAGDGKTAFIAHVLARSGAAYLPGTNEYRINIGVSPYLVVLDGSEDARERTNEALLLDAFRPFEGESPNEPGRGTLIAINKGRLLSFLEAKADRFPYLWRLVRSSLVSGDESFESPYEVIDLNDRTTVGPTHAASTFGGILRSLTEWEGWRDECPTCDAFNDCPVLSNVRALRSDAARERAWRVMAAVDLDDRLHVTARHVVTTLASIIVGTNTCPDIRAAVRDGRPPGPDDFVYNRLFSADDRGNLDPAAMDRALRGYDPSDLSSPKRDRRLAFQLVRGALSDLIDSEPRTDRSYLERAAERIEASSIDEKPASGEPEYRLQLLEFVASLSRRLYVVPDDSVGADLTPEFPVKTLDRFLTAIGGDEPLDHIRDSLISQLNATLGVTDHTVGGLLAPRDYARGLAGTGLAALLPSATFEVVRVTKLGGRFSPPEYVEAWPRALALVARDSGKAVASLTVPLLLFEVLDRSGRGFRPTTQTERGFMVRVAGFYRRLAEHKWQVPLAYALYDHGSIVGRAAVEPAKFVLTELH